MLSTMPTTPSSMRIVNCSAIIWTFSTRLLIGKFCLLQFFLIIIQILSEKPMQITAPEVNRQNVRNGGPQLAQLARNSQANSNRANSLCQLCFDGTSDFIIYSKCWHVWQLCPECTRRTTQCPNNCRNHYGEDGVVRHRCFMQVPDLSN